MGARSLMWRELRRRHQSWNRWQQQTLAPLAAPLQRRWQRRQLAQIRALARVEQLHWHGCPRPLQRLALLCHYAPQGRLQRCMRRLLEDLQQRGWSVLVLSSGLDADAQAWCRQRQIAVLQRRNQGRDFGAFQDGWLALAHEGLVNSIEQLLLLNDSVYPVVDLEASSWPRFLAGDPAAVVGFSDSFQNGYHLQSYALHIPAGVLQQPWWHQYWWGYPGWGGTAVAIRDGEIGLSQLLLRHGVPLKALHGVAALRAWLTSADLHERLLALCSAPAAELLLRQLLESCDQSIIHLSPSHQLAIPLLLQGFPFIKRDLLESNESRCLDPLLLTGGAPQWLDPDELVDFLRPPIIGYKL